MTTNNSPVRIGIGRAVVIMNRVFADCDAALLSGLKLTFGVMTRKFSVVVIGNGRVVCFPSGAGA